MLAALGFEVKWDTVLSPIHQSLLANCGGVFIIIFWFFKYTVVRFQTTPSLYLDPGLLGEENVLKSGLAEERGKKPAVQPEAKARHPAPHLRPKLNESSDFGLNLGKISLFIITKSLTLCAKLSFLHNYGENRLTVTKCMAMEVHSFSHFHG